MGNGFKEFVRPLLVLLGVTVLPLLVVLAIPTHVNPHIMLVGRFQLVAPGSNSAYDTVTGQMCWLYDPIGKGSEKIPLCKDIYDGR